MNITVENQTSSHINIPESMYNLTAAYLVTVLILSGVLNCLAACVLAFKDKFSSAQSTLLFSLTASNALFTVLSTPLGIHANVSHEWNMGKAACTYYGFMTFTGGLSSIFHLLLLSLERFIAIVHPFQVSILLQPCYLYLSLLFGWLLVFTITSMPLIGWSRYNEEGIGTSCSVDLFPTTTNGISYTIFIIIIGYVIPLSITVGFNIGFLKEVQRIINRGKRRRAGYGGADRAMTKAERELMKQMCLQVVALVATFNISWLPYAVTVVLSLIRGKPFESRYIASVPSYFAKSYTVYDPLIFFILNKKFRSMLKRWIFGHESQNTDRVEIEMCNKGMTRKLATQSTN